MSSKKFYTNKKKYPGMWSIYSASGGNEPFSTHAFLLPPTYPLFFVVQKYFVLPPLVTFSVFLVVGIMKKGGEEVFGVIFFFWKLISVGCNVPKINSTPDFFCLD